jgi:hypothetical protein
MDNWITGHGKVWITTHRSPPPGFNLLPKTDREIGSWCGVNRHNQLTIYDACKAEECHMNHWLLALQHRHSALCLPECSHCLPGLIITLQQSIEYHHPWLVDQWHSLSVFDMKIPVFKLPIFIKSAINARWFFWWWIHLDHMDWEL